MKLFSWNVNGLRSTLQKGKFQEFIQTMQPDILCLQETKAKKGQAEVDLPDYEEIWNDADKPGYSGTAIFTRVKPLSISTVFKNTRLTSGLSDEFGDATKEGRLVTAEFADFYLINTYSPHTKRELERLPLKLKWDVALLDHMLSLQQTKPVIVCGDFNIAHQEIDLANPKQNARNAGFTTEERADFDRLVEAGFIDTFRTLHPFEVGAYTWWTWRANARARNVGWRIDYFVVSNSLFNKVQSATIYPEQMGSDHCPISLELKT